VLVSQLQEDACRYVGIQPCAYGRFHNGRSLPIAGVCCN
jgi:hypothetical protein